MGRIQLHIPQLSWLVILALVVALVAVIGLYRGQVSAVRSRLGWGLPVLRTVALGSLMFSLLRPEILTPTREQQRSVVAVLVDQSRSMSVVDSTRSEAQLVQLAAALGSLPEQVRSPRMSELRNDISGLTPLVDEVKFARSDQDYAQIGGRGIEAAAARLREARRELSGRVADLSAGAPEGLAEMVTSIDNDDPITSFSRMAQVMTRIDLLQQQADLQLYRDNAEVRDVCATLAASSRIELVGQALEPASGLLERIAADRPVELFGLSRTLIPLPRSPGTLEADGIHGDLATVEQAIRGRLADARLGAIVLFTDGDRIAGAGSDPVFGSDIPVFAVSAAPTVQRDLSIERVWIPQRVFAGQTIQVAVAVRAAGYNATRAELTIESAGQRQSRPATIVDGSAVARLSLRIEQAGPQVLRVGVTPLPGEATTENNHVERVLKVVSDRTRVALLGGKATPDFEYFRESLAGDPSIEAIDRIVVDGTRAALYAEQIIEQDVVVLVELPQEALDGRQWDALNRLVSQRGGTVIVATTDPAIAAGYTANPLAATLLPWRGDLPPTSRVWPGAEPVFRINPATVNGAQTLRLWDDSDSASPRWSDFSPVFRFLSSPPLRSAAEPLLVERDSNKPVLAQQRLGAGRIVFIGLEELWRWRGGWEQDQTDRLWLRLVHQVAREPYALSAGTEALDSDKFRAQPGEPVHVRARAATGATLEVRRDNAVVMSRALTRVPGGVHLETTLTELPPGEYTLHLALPDGTRRLGLPLRIGEDLEAEMRDVSRHEAELRRLVGVRGEVLQLEEVNSLPGRLSKLKESDPPFVQTRLWDSPYLFLFVLACLGLEWALRKRVGLM